MILATLAHSALNSPPRKWLDRRSRRRSRRHHAVAIVAGARARGRQHTAVNVDVHMVNMPDYHPDIDLILKRVNTVFETILTLL